jgi:hypothetical protein
MTDREIGSRLVSIFVMGARHARLRAASAGLASGAHSAAELAADFNAEVTLPDTEPGVRRAGAAAG